MRPWAVACRPMPRLEIHPFDPGSPRRRGPAARGAPRRAAAWRAEPACRLRGAGCRARRDRGAAHGGRLGRRRYPRRRRRRLPDRDAARGSELGPERLGRGRRACRRARRGRSRPLRTGRGALGRGGPHVALRDRARVRRRARRRMVPPRLRAAARPRGPRGSRDAADRGTGRRRDPPPHARRHRRALAELELALPAHQQLSPVFSPLAPPDVRGGDGRVGGGLRRPGLRHLRRRRRRPRRRLRGRLLDRPCPAATRESCARTTRASSASPPSCPRLAAPAIGQALGTTVLDWAAAEGYGAVVTDWRATNLLSSRTWPQLGWRPTFYRLHRAIA